MNEVNASIITIGDELLIGQTIDTNSAFIAQELNKIGVWVKRRVAIADDRQAILDPRQHAAQVRTCDAIPASQSDPDRQAGCGSGYHRHASGDGDVTKEKGRQIAPPALPPPLDS